VKFLPLLLAGAIGFSWGPSARAQTVIVNGSLEINGGDNSSTAPPWVVAGHASFQGDEGRTDGSFAAAFNAGVSTPNDGVLSQTFNTIALQLYTVTFDWGNFGADATQQLQIEVVNGTNELITPGSGMVTNGTGPDNSGATIIQNTNVLQIQDSTGSGFTGLNAPAPNAEFSRFSFTFTAQSSSSTIIFTDMALSTASSDSILDNIQVIPEPSTWAMMGVGAMMLLGVVRFRRRLG
jgi:PEP-CTERM motif